MSIAPGSPTAAVAGAYAEWLAAQIAKLEASGLSREEAVRAHNAFLRRAGINDLVTAIADAVTRKAGGPVADSAAHAEPGTGGPLIFHPSRPGSDFSGA